MAEPGPLFVGVLHATQGGRHGIACAWRCPGLTCCIAGGKQGVRVHGLLLPLGGERRGYDGSVQGRSLVMASPLIADSLDQLLRAAHTAPLRAVKM